MRREYRVSKRETVKLLIFAVFLVVVAGILWFGVLALTVNAVAYPYLWLIGNYVAIIVLVGLVAIAFSSGAIKYLKRWHQSKSGIVVADEGLTVYGERMKWSDIQEVHEDQLDGLVIRLKPPLSGESRPTSILVSDFPLITSFLRQLKEHNVPIRESKIRH